jgi:hypothetical protein
VALGGEDWALEDILELLKKYDNIHVRGNKSFIGFINVQ